MNSAELIASRQATHGSPLQNHRNIAALWSGYLGAFITPAQVAVMMVLLKIARTKSNPNVKDHWDDAAAYIAIAAECQEVMRSTSQGPRPQVESLETSPSPSASRT